MAVAEGFAAGFFVFTHDEQHRIAIARGSDRFDDPAVFRFPGLFFGGDGIVVFVDLESLGIVDLEGPFAELAQAVHNGDARRRGRVRAVMDLVGVRPDDCQILDCGAVERQRVVIIFQKDNALFRRLAGERAVLRRVHDLLGFFGSGAVGVFEKPEDELVAQDAGDGLIEHGFLDRAAFHQFGEMLEAIVVLFGGQFEIHACVDRAARRFGVVLADELTVDHAAYAVVVRDDITVESPLAAEDVREQPAVDVAGNAVDLVVGGHDRADVGLLDGDFKRIEMHVAEDSLREIRGGHVGAPLRLAVAGEVFEAGQQVLPADVFVTTLQSLHRGDANAGNQIGILTVKLVKSPETRLAREIEHGSGGVGDAVGPHFKCDGRKNAFNQCCIPCAGKSKRHGKHRGIVTNESVAGLTIEKRRNPQAGFLHQIGLNGSVEFRKILGRQLVVVFDRADAVFNLRQRESNVIVNGLVLQQLREIRPEVELCALFLKRHARQEILQAFLDGEF